MYAVLVTIVNGAFSVKVIMEKTITAGLMKIVVNFDNVVFIADQPVSVSVANDDQPIFGNIINVPCWKNLTSVLIEDEEKVQDIKKGILDALMNAELIKCLRSFMDNNRCYKSYIQALQIKERKKEPKKKIYPNNNLVDQEKFKGADDWLRDYLSHPEGTWENLHAIDYDNHMVVMVLQDIRKTYS